MTCPPFRPAARPASLMVIDPNGHRTRVPIEPLPFRIGRQPESDLIIRDSRVSRTHARIVAENGEYVIEDCGSRHGTFVNGKRIERPGAAQFRPHRIRRAGFLPAHFRARRRGAEAHGGADGRTGRRRRADRRARRGRQPGQAARHPRSGAHAAKLLFGGRRAGLGGGYGAYHHRRRARFPVLRAPTGWIRAWRATSAATICATAICACRAR